MGIPFLFSFMKKKTQKKMSDEYFEADNNEADLNPDDEEYNAENISEEGDQQIEEELKEEEKNRNPEDDEKMEQESDENFEIVDNQAVENTQKLKKKNVERITPRFMTKYERARVIGTRALQISKNSIVYVYLGKGFFLFVVFLS